jgi:hypothetical protein
MKSDFVARTPGQWHQSTGSVERGLASLLPCTRLQSRSVLHLLHQDRARRRRPITSSHPLSSMIYACGSHAFLRGSFKPKGFRGSVPSRGSGSLNDWAPEASPTLLVNSDGEKDCAEMDMVVHVCTPHLLQTLYIHGTGINLDRLCACAAGRTTCSVWKTVHPYLRKSRGPEQAFDAEDN